MNTLTIIVLLVLAVFALNGYMRGFVRTLASMALFVLASILVYYATPYVGNFLKTETPLYETVREKSEEFLEVWLENQTAEDLQGEEQEHLIEELPLPGILKKQLENSYHSNTYGNLMADTFARHLAGYAASFFVNLLSYIATFLLVTAALRAAVMALDVMAHLPILRGVNRMLGLFLGLLQGVGVLWIAFLILTVFVHTDLGRRLMQMVNESPILSVLYDGNIFLRLVFGLTG